MTTMLSKGRQGITYKVLELNGNPETNRYLNNIGLYVGEPITIISILSSSYIVNIKDGRFGIDRKIADLIKVDIWRE